jgi:hypothetical protein
MLQCKQKRCMYTLHAYVSYKITCDLGNATYHVVNRSIWLDALSFVYPVCWYASVETDLSQVVCVTVISSITTYKQVAVSTLDSTMKVHRFTLVTLVAMSVHKHSLNTS